MEQTESTIPYSDIEDYLLGTTRLVVDTYRASTGEEYFPSPSESVEAHIEALKDVWREGAAEDIEQVVALLYELSA